MIESKNSLKLKHLQKYFMPMEIDAKLILEAFKIQQNKRMLQSSRATKNEQFSKVELLRVTGKQVQSFSPSCNRIKTHKNNLKHIKLVLDNPFEQIYDVISHDPDHRHYKQQLQELQKLNKSFSAQQQPHIIKKGIFSQKQFDAPRMTDRKSPETSKDSMSFYEEMILNNPVLYRKIMMAYNNSKRHLEWENSKFKTRKLSLRRQTVYERKMGSKPMIQVPKNSIELKKNINFIQYRQFQLAIGLTNKTIIYSQQDILYKAFICKGNNGLLVKSLLKTRPWWAIRGYSQMDSCNLVWTQWKKTKIINNLTTKPKRQYKKNSFTKIQNTSSSKKREYILIAQKKMNQFKKIVNKDDDLWSKYEKMPHCQSYLTFSRKVNDPKFEQIAKEIFSNQVNYEVVQKQNRAHNHISGCLQLHSKKLLLLNLKRYYCKQNKDPFEIIPLTFHIINGSEDPQFIKFASYFDQQKVKNKQSLNIWICKPGQNSNRGNGIVVLNNLNQIKSLANSKCVGGKTLMIQKYFENPLLYNRRKFDIRCYILITTVNGIIKGYWYEEGYIRTASKEFNLKNLQNKFIHLTNDAIQKKGEEYGRYENYNKISYTDFQKYLQQNHSQENFKFENTVEKMKAIATDLILSAAHKLNPKKKQYSFQIFGLDFMLDDHANPFLIQANSNPCIEVDGSVLGKVIPQMLQNVLRVAIDPIFPPPYGQFVKNRFSASNPFQSNKMVIIYDSLTNENGKQILQQKQINQEQMEQIQQEVEQ